MSKKRYKEQLRKAIEQASERLFHDAGQPKKTYLYLTKKQYESDPDGWHEMLRQRGLPDDSIMIVPSVFDTKGGFND